MSDGFLGDSGGFPRVLMGFPRVLYSSRGNPYNHPAVFINTLGLLSDSHAFPTVKMEKHAAISAIHVDPHDCWVEWLGIQREPPGFRTARAGCWVEIEKTPMETLEIALDP